MISGAARFATEKAVFRPALPMSFSPGISEMHMATLTYREQYLHPNWQRKRLETLEAAGFACEVCGDPERTLNVHHKRYVKGRMVWEYGSDELQCLCEPCHLEHHEQRALLDALLLDPNVSLPAVIGLVGGFLEGSLMLDESVAKEAARVGESHFDLGILASIVSGMPDNYSRATDAVMPQPMTPVQEDAVKRWRDFTTKLERSGL